MSAFPPYRTSGSIPIDQATALKYLSTYLSEAETTPYLLPNARLEPSGPTSGSSNSSVTIHNLKRVEAGLRGEWLAPTLEFEENVPIANDRVEDIEDGAMDLDEYQREQSIEGGEIGEDGTHVVRQQGDSDLEVEKEKKSYEEEEDEFANAEEDEEDRSAPTPKKLKKSDTPQDKAARKAAKKARRKAEKVTVMNSKQDLD